MNAEQTCSADYRTNNLLPSGRNFIRFDDIPNHCEEECINDVTPALFVHWSRNNKTICSDAEADMSVQKYINSRWDGGAGHPTIHLYKNVWLRSFYSPIQNLAPETFTCQYLNKTRGEFKADARNTFCMNQPATRVASFNPWNPHERFHVPCASQCGNGHGHVQHNKSSNFVHCQRGRRGSLLEPQNLSFCPSQTSPIPHTSSLCHS